MLNISLNGEKRGVEEGTTLDGLLEGLMIKRQGMAVEVNREIIPKRLYMETRLKDGDSVEIVRMAGGG
ncbi:MAG: sulfur carrier protein ThiS [Deltaproteobacteria bacterium]|nr:sulfur carrier protein ThiS [Deltaproteobacteria bacterium]